MNFNSPNISIPVLKSQFAGEVFVVATETEEGLRDYAVMSIAYLQETYNLCTTDVETFTEILQYLIVNYPDEINDEFLAYFVPCAAMCKYDSYLNSCVKTTPENREFLFEITHTNGTAKQNFYRSGDIVREYYKKKQSS